MRCFDIALSVRKEKGSRLISVKEFEPTRRIERKLETWSCLISRVALHNQNYKAKDNWEGKIGQLERTPILKFRICSILSVLGPYSFWWTARGFGAWRVELPWEGILNLIREACEHDFKKERPRPESWLEKERGTRRCLASRSPIREYLPWWSFKCRPACLERNIDGMTARQLRGISSSGRGKKAAFDIRICCRGRRETRFQVLIWQLRPTSASPK